MSGPKCSQYELDQRIARQQLEAEENRKKEAERQRLEEIRLVREWTEKIELETQSILTLNTLIDSSQNHFPSEKFPSKLNIPVMPLNLNSVVLQEHFNILKGMSNQSNELIRAINFVVANAGLRKIISQTSADVGDDLKSLDDWLNEIQAAKAGISVLSFEARKATTARLLKGLGDSDHTENLKLAMKSYLQETQIGRIEMLEMELRIALQHARQLALNKRKQKAEAEAMLLQLPTIDSSEISSIREELYKVACGLVPLDGELQTRVTNAQRDAEANIIARTAGDIAASVLKDLGFSVTESFTTLFIEGGEVYTQRPESNEYHVALRVNTDTKQLTLRVIRDGLVSSTQTPARTKRDAEEEDHFCKDFPKIINALSEAGIRTTLVSAGKPGVVDVEVVDLSSTGREKRREHSRVKLKSKSGKK